jgi:hypothetical protein
MLVERFASIVGPAGIVADPDIARGYMSDWRGLYEGKGLYVLRPSTVEQVSRILQLCHAERVGVVPQGGNTNLTIAAAPDQTGQQIVLSTSRLRRIRDVDAVDMTIVAEAGVTVAELQAAAIDADTLFPLSFAAEGSATLGGAISTNAGGTAALRYGSTRDLLLGLEVVLPDGRVWNGLRRLHKDNAGYALRHVFAGAEGTLGVITAAARAGSGSVTLRSGRADLRARRGRSARSSRGIPRGSPRAGPRDRCGDCAERPAGGVVLASARGSDRGTEAVRAELQARRRRSGVQGSRTARAVPRGARSRLS